jgi:hypothetical protein
LTIRTPKLIPTCSYSSSLSDEPNTNNEPRIRQRQFRVMHTACVWSEKTTVAVYSVIKELVVFVFVIRIRANANDESEHESSSN